MLHALRLKNVKSLVTSKEILRCLATVLYRHDRRRQPDRRRYGQFVVGWKAATVRRQPREYTARTLRSLTWRNLGFRFGQYFGEISKEKIEEVWNDLVSHYE